MSYPFPVKNDPLADQWVNTFQCLKDAESENKLDYQFRSVGVTVVPGEVSDLGMELLPANDKINALNFSFIGEYLYLLGYLTSKPAKGSHQRQNKAEFKKAVKKFQEDAGLIVDSWVGDQSWRALQALVGFESDTDIQRWTLPDGSYCKAFQRAVQLRLSCYGLVDVPPGPSFSGINEKSKLPLKKLLWSIGLLKDYNASADDTLLYELLFDADKLLEAAYNTRSDNEDFSDALLEDKSHKGIKVLKRRFLVNVAKIEIWLHGGDIKLNGADDYSVKGLGVKRRVIGSKGSKKLVKATGKGIGPAIKNYWVDALGVDAKTAENKSKEITPELLRSFINPEDFHSEERVTVDDSDYSEKIAEMFEKADNPEQEIEKAMGVTRSLGMKVLDGIKRVWRWIKKGIQRIVNFSKNLYRGFFRFANKAYKAVRLAYTAFARSMSQYIKGNIETASSAITVSMSKDFDTLVVVDDNVNANDVDHATNAVKRFGAMFNLSCAIIGSFISILMKSASGVVGWIKLSLELVKSYKYIKGYYRQLSDLLSVR